MKGCRGAAKGFYAGFDSLLTNLELAMVEFRFAGIDALSNAGYFSSLPIVTSIRLSNF